VELVITQPRAPHKDGPIRRWETDVLTLQEFASDLLAAADATEREDAPLKAGEHCRFCPAAGRCPELRRHTQEIARVDFDDLPKKMRDPRGMEPAEISQVLNAAPLIENWFKELRAYAQKQLETGKDLPGFKLVPKRGTRVWTLKDGQIADQLRELGLEEDQIWNRKLVSPAQAEKKVPKAVRQDLNDLWQMVSSGTVLAPADDPRPAVSSTPGDDFAGIE